MLPASDFLSLRGGDKCLTLIQNTQVRMHFLINHLGLHMEMQCLFFMFKIEFVAVFGGCAVFCGMFWLYLHAAAYHQHNQTRNCCLLLLHCLALARKITPVYHSSACQMRASNSDSSGDITQRFCGILDIGATDTACTGEGRVKPGGHLSEIHGISESFRFVQLRVPKDAKAQQTQQPAGHRRWTRKTNAAASDILHRPQAKREIMGSRVQNAKKWERPSDKTFLWFLFDLFGEITLSRTSIC